MGSVFSPYYAKERARHRSRGEGVDPLNHCAMNVAIYRRGGKDWAFREHGKGAVQQSQDGVTIGRSSLHVVGHELRLHLDEQTCPWPGAPSRRVRGTVTIPFDDPGMERFRLDRKGRHRWGPLITSATAIVELDEPGLKFRGSAYVDRNDGDEPLEDAFRGWTWSRTSTAQRTLVAFDVTRSDGSSGLLSRIFVPGKGSLPSGPLHRTPLGPTGWALGRPFWDDTSGCARLKRTVEDGPFYARSIVETALDGEPAHAVHESLSLTRFRSPWVQALLPYRAKRVSSVP